MCNRSFPRPSTRLLRGVLLGAGSLVLTFPVPALSAAAAASDDTSSTVAQQTIEEVVVTALKRETTLVDAPAAITVIGAAELQEQRIVSLADIAARVPGLRVGEAAGVDQVSIRGIGIDSATGGIENSTAIHVDGVYLGQATAMRFLAFDPASVEVLRGPQGTLYGRNATGGTINFVTAKPTPYFEAFTDVGVANYETVSADGVVSGPISDSLQGRLAVTYRNQNEGYIENHTTGNSIGPSQSVGARGSLRFQPGAAVTVDAQGFYYSEDNDGIMIVRRNLLSADARARNPVLNTVRDSRDPWNVYVDAEPEGKRWMEGGIVSATIDLSSAFSLRSTTGYTETGIDNRNVESDGTEASLGVGNRREVTRALQQELDLNFKLIDERLAGVLGLFYYDDTLRLDYELPWLPNPQGFVNVSGRPLPSGTATVSHFYQDTRSTALFGDASFELAGPLSLYGGFRVSSDEKDLTLTMGLAGLPGNVGLTCQGAHYKADFDSSTGKAGLRYKFGNGGTLYGQVQEGFKAGGFNPFGCNDTFEPEEITAYEVGYKIAATDLDLYLSTAAFYYDYTNLQVAQIVDAAVKIDNAAAATIQGVEVELAWKPAGAWRADAALTWLDAQYEDYRDLDTLNPALGLQDLSGNPTLRAPEFSGTLGIEYVSLLPSIGELRLRGEVSYSSEIYFRPYHNKADAQDAYTVGNVFLTVKPGERLSVRAFVKNVTDKDYLVGLWSAGTIGDRWANYAAPRTFGVSVGYRY